MRRKIMILAALSFVALLVVVLTLLAMPTVRDVPDALEISEIRTGGRRLLLIDDQHTDSISQMLIVRCRERKSREIIIDMVAAPFLWYTRRSIVSDFPRVIDLGSYAPGHYDIIARIGGRYQKVYEVDVPRS